MKKYILLLIFLSWVIDLGAQSIRKNYQEMTDSEKLALVNAFYDLRNGPDLVNDLAQFHNTFFSFGISTSMDIHNNLMAEPDKQIFFAWHRMQIFEIEQAMQVINPNISIPFWDSSVDQDINSALWDESFMGSFDANWGLGRTVGQQGNLPTPATVTNLQATPGANWPPPTSGSTGFYVYANNMERGSVHLGGHGWIAGAMNSRSSPRDPIFYLHHGNVDRLWTEWEGDQLSGQGSFHIISNTMLRYDGTYNFNGLTLPQVDPDFIANPKILGLFYAQNQLAELYDYTVSVFGSSNDLRQAFNAHEENFYYQYLILAGNNFIVPPGASCKIESVTEINLIPGFNALSGSTFIAKIDSDNNVGTIFKNTEPLAIISNQKPFNIDEDGLKSGAYGPEEYNVESINIRAYPNPFDDRIMIEMDKAIYSGKITLYDISGRVVFFKTYEKQGYMVMDNLRYLPSGMYILEVGTNNETVLRKKFIKK